MSARNLLSAKQQTGNHYEDQACQFLKAQGLQEIGRNFRCRQGELDLIMQDGGILVFVEVRYRKSTKYGSAAESITTRKQSRIIAAAQHFLAQRPTKMPIRFDALVFDGSDTCQWLKNAFPI